MLNQFLDVFASLNSHGVRYLVIGGIAAIVHGVPRTTVDLDILIEASPENAHRLLDALGGANFGTALLTSPEELLKHEITIFRDRLRVDVQTLTPGLVFAEAWKRRVEITYKGQIFFVVSRADLITSKKAAGEADRSRRCRAPRFRYVSRYPRLAGGIVAVKKIVFGTRRREMSWRFFLARVKWEGFYS